MWRKLIYILLFVLFTLIVILVYMHLTTAQDELNTDSAMDKSGEMVYFSVHQIEDAYPMAKTGDTIIKHKAYHLLYNEEFEQANWVAYILTRAMVEKSDVERSDNFMSDPFVFSKSASPSDYVKTGFDRGHLVPAADMNWSEEAMRESFYMSNMSPQLPAFNRGIWKQLEEMVRQWAVENDSLYVVTGPYLEQIEMRIGENNVGVPKYYYKAILDISWQNGYKAAGYWLANEKGDATMLEPISIDELEKLTGIDFFYGIENDAIEKIESRVKASEWK